MSKDEQIKEMTEIGFPDIYARVYVRAAGLCEYCGIDVISDRIAYASVQIDHVHPQSQGGKDELDNFALSCNVCNSLKSDWVAGHLSVEASREDRILAASKLIESKRLPHDREWNQVKQILRSKESAKST